MSSWASFSRVVSQSQRRTSRFGEKRLDLLLDFFAAQPVLADLVAAAHGAFFRHLARIPAAVTEQFHPRKLGMEDHQRLALRAFDRRSACAAEDIGRRASSIEKKNRLFTPLKRAGQCLDQCIAEDAAMTGLQLLPHVHDADGWQRRTHGNAAIIPGSQPARKFQQVQPSPSAWYRKATGGVALPRMQTAPLILAYNLRCSDRMIERRLGLVIRRIMAFIQNDQTGVRQR